MSAGRWPETLGGMKLELFLDKAEEFHGHISPGVVTGGFLVDAALEAFNTSEYLNAVVESVVCLPDAVQLLTPCTLGNGFLQVLDWGKFAVTLYDRQTLEGVRAWLEVEKVKRFPLVAGWYIRDPQAPRIDKEVVIREILGCGERLVSRSRIRMKQSLKNLDKVPTGICPACGESYPLRFGPTCAACGGQAYYQVAEG